MWNGSVTVEVPNVGDKVKIIGNYIGIPCGGVVGTVRRVQVNKYGIVVVIGYTDLKDNFGNPVEALRSGLSGIRPADDNDK